MVATTQEVTTTTALVKTGEGRSLAKPSLLRPIARPAEIIESIQEMQALLAQVLVEGIDYGVIPGTGEKGKPPRKVLFKAGAEKISRGFGCHPEFECLEHEVDHERVMRFKSAWVEAPKRTNKADEEQMKAAGKGRFRKVDDAWQWQEKGEGFEETTGIYRFRYKCRMVLFDGTIVGEGEGVCSSLESKYRSRPLDVENTIVKMAQKRARMAATLDAFSLSDAFTQDVGDEEDGTIQGEVVQSPAKQAVAATQEAMREAGISTANNNFNERPAKEIEERKRNALTWAVAYLDKLDKAGALPTDPDEEAKKGALEAFKMIVDENVTPVRALATVDQRLAETVTVYSNVLEAHINGVEWTLNDAERTNLAWISSVRGPHKPTVEKSPNEAPIQ